MGGYRQRERAWKRERRLGPKTVQQVHQDGQGLKKRGGRAGIVV
jgi:hypothetical protein